MDVQRSSSGAVELKHSNLTPQGAPAYCVACEML
jgi:hypothetical protein